MATKWLAGIASMWNFRVAVLHRLNSPISSSDAYNSCSMRFAAAARTVGVTLLDSNRQRWRVRSMSALPDSTNAHIPKETLDGTPNGPGSTGPNEPPKVSSRQDKVVPEALEDKWMWRKWIEERLTESGNAGKETDQVSIKAPGLRKRPVRSSLGSVSNFRNPFRRDNASSSLLSDRQAARNAPQDDLDDFEYRLLGSANDEDNSVDDDFLRDLDEIGRSMRGTMSDIDENLDMGEDDDWSDEKANVLTDLALSNMEVFDLEDEENPYRMRSNGLFFPRQTYDPEDLDLSKEAAIEKPTVRTRKRYPSKDVFQVADFRNPRYLSKFIRESSKILPRRHFQISAKAQRKDAREIKTARILGLMPFTSMGDPPFRFLRSRSEDNANAGRDDY